MLHACLPRDGLPARAARKEAGAPLSLRTRPQNGGTSLSIALALTTRPTCGSAISSHVPALLPATCERVTAARGDPTEVALCGALRACTKRWRNDSAAWLLYDEHNADVPRLNFKLMSTVNFSSRARDCGTHAHCADQRTVTTFGHNRPEVLGRLFPSGPSF